VPTFTLAPGSGHEVHTLADLDTYLGAIAAAGFDGVTLSSQQLVGDPEGAARLVERHGLRCTDILALRVSRDDEATLADARALRPAVDALGAGHCLAMLYTRVSPESIDRLGRCSEALGVPLALEFGPAPCPTVAAAAEVVEAVGPDRIGVLPDTFHFVRMGSTFEMLEALPVDRLPIVQFNDALPAISDDYMAETTNRRAWPGQGELPLQRFATTLLDRGWDGVVSVEVLSEPLRQLPITEYARQALETTRPYWT
jgi:sugar phosphate isomerase/epimerase